MKKSIIAPIVAILVMAVMLSAVNRGFTATEAKYEAEELSIMLHNLLPHSVEFAEEEYTGEDTNIQKVYKAENGYVIETLSYGYADNIQDQLKPIPAPQPDQSKKAPQTGRFCFFH